MTTVRELQFIISSKATVLCCKLVEVFEGPRSIHWSLQRSASYPSQLALSELSEEAWNQIFPTSLTGDVTSEIAKDDWERGCAALVFKQKSTYRPVISLLSP